jgi:hypothetical protein
VSHGAITRCKSQSLGDAFLGLFTLHHLGGKKEPLDLLFVKGWHHSDAVTKRGQVRHTTVARISLCQRKGSMYIAIPPDLCETNLPPKPPFDNLKSVRRPLSFGFDKHHGFQPIRASSPPSVRIASLRGTTLANLSGIVKQLSAERDRLHQQLSGLNAALEALAGMYGSTHGINPRRKMSAKGRERIAAAQRARWAKVNGQRKVVPIAKPKRTMSASARRKIAAAQRARWAKVKREKKAA